MINKMKQNPELVMLLLGIVFYGLLWFCGNKGGNITSDGVRYYEYFVRLFIDYSVNEGVLIKYPAGTIIMLLPFLIPTKIICGFMNISMEGGYSIYFQFAVFLGALVYLVLTVIVIYIFLKKRYSATASVMSCLCLVAGTMVPVYMCEHSSFSHIYGLFMCTVFFVYVEYYEKNYNNSKVKSRILMDCLLGMLIGFIAMIRNTT